MFLKERRKNEKGPNKTGCNKVRTFHIEIESNDKRQNERKNKKNNVATVKEKKNTAQRFDTN